MEELLNNRHELIRGFAALLTAIEQVSNLSGNGAAAPRQSAAQPNIVTLPFEQIKDTFTGYEEHELADGRKVRRYDTGAVRIINPKSQVMQEERPNGNLLVSLHSGKVIFQEQPGFPLLVFNSVQAGPPRLGRVAMVQFGSDTEPCPAFHFEDEEGGHFVVLETLRYIKVNSKQAA